MRDLRLVAVTPEGGHVVLEDGDENQYRLRIDERLEAALPSRRPLQLESAMDSRLAPREIQARIRAGQSVTDVAAAAGMPLARVERYASAVLAERAHIARQAQAAPCRRHSGGNAPSLAEVIEARLTEQHVPVDSVSWDAWRSDDERWTVRLSYLAGERERAAEWLFDPRGQVLVPTDDEAAWLTDAAGLERSDEAPAARVRRLAAVPQGASEPAASEDEVYDVEADQREEEITREERPAVAVPQVSARAGRRPSVPSWDDIMFGTRKRD
jgi:hypothetical protein